jgi:imidazolonepropionase-like amidohydrolase
MINISNAKTADGKIVSIEIDNGIISKVSSKPIPGGIDAQNKLLLPGLVDLHTHLLRARQRGCGDSFNRFYGCCSWRVHSNLCNG